MWSAPADRLDELVEPVLDEIVDLGFAAVWIAVLDEPAGHLVTVKSVIDGVDTTHDLPPIVVLDMRRPIGHGFRERRMINVTRPDSLYLLEHDGGQVPEGRLALPRVVYDHLRGHPFACGPLLGSAGQPVGALGLSSYRGREPIPDEVLSDGLLRALIARLGSALERALELARVERSPAGRRIRVLAIDDDPDIVFVVRAYLERLDYEVETATSADDGLSAARRQAFDVVLCDFGMPGRSGLEVCELLRAAGYRGKIVLMTGWDGHAVETDARARTCDLVLKKPFVGNDLREALASLLGT